MKYRPEIDGLRAIAVVPVILFHAGFSLFGGGFVGVDVFFVISGYLITTILIDDLEKGQFSLARFYERRARRILPALFVVILACLPFAWFWMLPHQLSGFAHSLIYVALFASNIFFGHDDDYFAFANEEKPLLHTWSLAVEEQYYVVFPLLLLLLWRKGEHRTFRVIAALALVSLLLAEWGWRNEPTASFYFPISRAWELFAGSIVAFVVRWRGVRNSSALSVAGLIAIAYSVFAFDRNTPFPSLWTLIPVIGTCLVIVYGGRNTAAARLLSTPLLVGIGLVSYSAYLWHQPLFAFTRIRMPHEPGVWVMIALSVASVLIAIPTWRFVEQPLRGAAPLIRSRRALFAACLAGLAAITLAGTIGYRANGFVARLSEEERSVLAYLGYPRQAHYREGDCFLRKDQPPEEFHHSCWGDGAVLIWGDSHAAALAPGIRSLDAGAGQLTGSTCPPFLGYTRSRSPFCDEINDFVTDGLGPHGPDTIILHGNWKAYEPGDIAYLQNTFDRLRDRTEARIVVVGGMPQYAPSLPHRLLSEKVYLREPISIPADLHKVIEMDVLLQELAERNGIEFVSAVSALCDGESCVASIENDGAVIPIAWDYGHLTLEGAEYVAERLLGSAD